MKITSAVFILSSLCLGAAAGAQETEHELGKEMFLQYCSTCHGAEARGDGPLTMDLTVKVADLTKISARNDGEFPMLQVIQTIDGRSGVRGHGGPMPVYGGLFREELTPLVGRLGVEAIIRGRTLALAEYLLSLQE